MFAVSGSAFSFESAGEDCTRKTPPSLRDIRRSVVAVAESRIFEERLLASAFVMRVSLARERRRDALLRLASRAYGREVDPNQSRRVTDDIRQTGLTRSRQRLDKR